MPINEFKSLKPEGYTPPCPSLGEFLREIAHILETKPKSRNLDLLAREDKFDYELVTELCNEIFKLPFETHSKNAERVLENLKYDIIDGAYAEEIKNNFKPAFVIDAIDKEFSKNSLQWFTRAQVLPVIIENVAGPILFGCLLEFVDYQDNEITLLKNLFRSANPVAGAFQWLNEQYEMKYVEFRKKLDEKTKKSEQERSQRWCTGKQKALNTNLFDFLKRFEVHARLSNKEKDLINIIFFSAKCLENFFKATENITTKEKLINAMSQSVDEKQNTFINMWNYKTSNGKCVDDIYYKAYNSLKDLWKPGPKETTLVSPEKIEKALDDLISLAPSVDIHWWQRSRILGKYALFTGNHDAALKYYNDCMESIWYTGDIDLLESFHEALALASFFDDRPFVKRLKQKGIVFNLLGGPKHEPENPSVANKTSRSKDFVVEDWEVNAWANTFVEYFPEICFFSDLPVRARNYPQDGLIFLGPEDSYRTPNLKKPDLKFTISGKVYPQIVFFAEQGNSDAVEQLLKEGADINELSSSGESALLFVIQKLIPTVISGNTTNELNDTHLFDLILSSYKPTTTTINTTANKKKLTCLGCAVETGKPKIVEAILKSGATVNQKYSLDLLSPLYKAVQQSKVWERPGPMIHPDQLDGFRRGNPFLHGKTNDEVRDFIETMRQDEDLDNITSMCYKLLSVVYPQHAMLEIIRLLLDHRADPNQKHNNGYLRNYTPLMMTAEMNFIEAFKMMVDKGGNPNQKCVSPTRYGYRIEASCREIAYEWGADKIIHFLEENRIHFH
ncbi:MAG: hypothetical protein JW915_04685 [Chitinispirillaceae bacterium]|nr:hypothetical protein [Chitinispirillaceae bacterium]